MMTEKNRTEIWLSVDTDDDPIAYNCSVGRSHPTASRSRQPARAPRCASSSTSPRAACGQPQATRAL
jgi:hypothetical protein